MEYYNFFLFILTSDWVPLQESDRNFEGLGVVLRRQVWPLVKQSLFQNSSKHQYDSKLDEIGPTVANLGMRSSLKTPWQADETASTYQIH